MGVCPFGVAMLEDCRERLHMTPRVVGMNGLPAYGAAGIEAPVVEDPEGIFWPGDPEPGVSPPTEHDRSYLTRMHEEGFVRLTTMHWPWISGGVILYAHPAYVCPGPQFLDLGIGIGLSNLDADAGVYISYMHESDAHALMKTWWQKLLEDAEAALRRKNYDRAVDSANRAKFAVVDTAEEYRRAEQLADQAWEKDRLRLERW
jgi:hypothetical protein